MVTAIFKSGRATGLGRRRARTGVLAGVLLVCALLLSAGPARSTMGVSNPVNLTPPEITGTAQVGQTLSCSQGTWTDATSFGYRWNRDGVAITGAVASSYVLTAEDAGHSITCTVSATNLSGSTDATSAAVVPLALSVPGGTAPPTPPPAVLPRLPKASEVISLPSRGRCVSRRSFRIRIKRVPGIAFVSASVYVNRKRVTVLKGKRLTAPVNLRGLPRGTFAARIEVATADGRKLRHSRKYRTCEPRGQSKRRHRL